MVFKYFNHLFSKFRSKEVNNKKVSLNIPESLYTYINDVADILQLNNFKITKCMCMCQDKNTHYITVFFDSLPAVDTIIENSYAIAGYIDADNDIIYISRYILWPKDNLSLAFERLSDAELLFAMLHELRHLWQHKNMPDEYYASTAYGLEHQHDATEIDADAFAYAYLFSNKTPYSWVDMQHQKEEFLVNEKISNIYAVCRTQQARKIAQEYHFQNYLWIPPKE